MFIVLSGHLLGNGKSDRGLFVVGNENGQPFATREEAESCAEDQRIGEPTSYFCEVVQIEKWG